jgi:hypothetical protein|tara:strand:+ start:69 stop:308 length:240 start_codon:yes stop_codon:yes gene_type:complete
MKNITGRQLRMARVSMKLRVDDLSKKTGVPWARVQLLERDDKELSDNEKVQKIIKFFEDNKVVFEEGNEEYLPFIRIKK